MDPLVGKLLIANGDLFDPNFRQTVVLVGEHSDEGAIGVVLTRSAGIPVHEVVPALADVLPPGAELFLGGPVRPDAGIVVAEFERPDLAPRLVFGSIGFVTDGTDLQSLTGVRRARVFGGYSGWGPGQLEREIAEDSWIIEPARPDDVFCAEPDKLWRDVLTRKGGNFALLATMPPNPSLN